MSYLPDKKTLCNLLLLRGYVFIHLDSRKKGLIIPPHLEGRPQLVFQLGLDLIPDLYLDSTGVLGTLHFKTVPHRCFIPWKAIYAIVGEDGRGVVYREDAPFEMRKSIYSNTGEVVDLNSVRGHFEKRIVKRKSSEPRKIPDYLRVIK